MLELAGRIGDGVIAGTGLLPEVIADTVAPGSCRSASRGPRSRRRRHMVYDANVAP